MPKQTRPNMVVKTFRVPEPDWETFVEECERRGVNPTEAVRQLVVDQAKKSRKKGPQ